MVHFGVLFRIEETKRVCKCKNSGDGEDRKKADFELGFPFAIQDAGESSGECRLDWASSVVEPASSEGESSGFE